MKRSTLCGTAASLLCVGLLTTGAAVAQDTRSQTQEEYSTQEKYSTPDSQPSFTESYSPSSKPAALNECVRRERAGDSTMSESEARKACHDALRAERENHDNEPKPPHH
jgi:hypothetical protein